MIRFYSFKLNSLIILVLMFCSCTNESSNKETKSIDSSAVSAANPNETEITCPKCGFKKKEVMPTEVCQIKYTCTKCKAELFPKKGDCCVFCTYGTDKCPSMQE